MLCCKGQLLHWCQLCMQALVFYSRLADEDGQTTPEVWTRLAGCHQALGSHNAAADILLKILGGAI